MTPAPSHHLCPGKLKISKSEFWTTIRPTISITARALAGVRNAKPKRRLNRFEKVALLRIGAALALALLANLLPASRNAS
jgi:hypothetical protein